MNDADKKYLKDVEKLQPSLEIFNKMVQILKSMEEETNQLLNTANNYLLERPLIFN